MPEKLVKEAVASQERPCFESPAQLPSVIGTLNEWRNEQCSNLLESLESENQSFMKDDKEGNVSSNSFTPP
jgi:hypothetical protein